MPNFGTIPPGSPQQEAAYQRGYLTGVQTAIGAIEARLIEDDRVLIARWVDAIREWRASPDGRAFEPPIAPALD